MPADPIASLFYGVAKGFTQGVLEVIADKGPKLMTGLAGAWRAGWAATIDNAESTPGQDEAIKQQVNDAIQDGTLGGNGA